MFAIPRAVDEERGKYALHMARPPNMSHFLHGHVKNQKQFWPQLASVISRVF
jgi:hypothetical protein